MEPSTAVVRAAGMARGQDTTANAKTERTARAEDLVLADTEVLAVPVDPATRMAARAPAVAADITVAVAVAVALADAVVEMDRQVVAVAADRHTSSAML